MSTHEKPINQMPALSNTTALVDSQPSNPVKLEPRIMATFDDVRERLKLFQEYINEFMVPGVDYGIIKGYQKPSLFKSGAEKLCDIFGFSKHVEVTNRIEDWDKGVFSYEVKSTLINKSTGLIEAEGFGSCNSREKSYRNQDPFNIVNTILKMAKKTALVDAVLNATNSSGLFTQDIEDLAPSSQDLPFSSKEDRNVRAATSNQKRTIQSLAEQVGMPLETMLKMLQDRYRIKDINALSFDQADTFIKHLLAMKGIEVIV